MAINNTTIIVPGRPAFTVPGALSEAEVRSAFGSELGLTNMTADIAAENTGSTTRTIEFKHRSGNKGA